MQHRQRLNRVETGGIGALWAGSGKGYAWNIAAQHTLTPIEGRQERIHYTKGEGYVDDLVFP